MARVPSRSSSRTATQRAGLLVCVLALLCAPVLASLWPALGRGPMLYVGEPATHEAAAREHAQHHHATELENGDPAADAATAHAGHTQYCALCVLVAQGWAPLVHLGDLVAAYAPAQRATPRAAADVYAAEPWPGAQPRAPPPLS